MSSVENYLHDLSRYDAWANRELIASLGDAVGADPRVLRLLGHVVAGKRVWVDRIDGRDTFDRVLWPNYSAAEAGRLLRDADARLLALTANEGTDFSRVIEYRNQTGRYFKTRLADIIIHLVNHGTYHRGQLASAVKVAGGNAAVTDYIVWERAGSPTVTP